MNTAAFEIARERQLDWLLAEVLGETPRAAAPARGAWTRRQWLAAAIVLLAIGVAFAVAALRDTPHGMAPVQDPDAPIDWRECDRAHVDELSADVVSLRCFDFDDAAIAKLARCTRLERLDLSGMRIDARGVSEVLPITDAGVAQLATLSTLRWLSLQHCEQVEGRTLAVLRAIPRLEHLDLTHTGVTSEGLAALPQLPSLREVSLSYCLGFHGRSLADVAKLPGLRRLELEGCATVSAADVAQLANLHELRHLDLRDCMGRYRGQTEAVVAFDDITNGGAPRPEPPKHDEIGVTDVAVAALAKLPLEALLLGGCEQLTDAIAPTLRGLAGLRTVDLGTLPKTTPKVLEALHPTLVKLSIAENGHYPASDLAQLVRFTQLTELDLRGVRTIDDGLLADIVAGKPLRFLGVGGTERSTMAFGGRTLSTERPDGPALTAACAKALAGVTTLERLEASYSTWFDPKVATAVAALPRLRALDLRCARVPAGGLAPLARSRSLRTLSLAFASTLTIDELRGLAGAPLTSLDLMGTPVDPVEIRKLADAFPGCDIRLPDHTHVGGGNGGSR